MKYFIYTTGCRSNQYDSYVLEENLKKEGHLPASFEEADLFIVNACTVTESAERDGKRFIRKVREKKPDAKIILTGCHAQVYPERNFGAELVLGQKEKFQIVNFLDRSGTYVSELNDGELYDWPIGLSTYQKRTRFFLKIQDGCDRFCSYCVVPYARGKPKSRSVNQILNLMGELKDLGIKEVVLSGIEISLYHDPTCGLDLKGLLRLLEEAKTPERIRLSSVDPLYVDSEFINIMASSKKITPSIHLSVQSASDVILERMGRKYNRSYLEEVIQELKAKVKNIGIGMDIIVGFPGEGEAEFLETLKFVESMDIYYLHVFPFSSREKTFASRMDRMVDEVVKRKRVKIMKDLDRRCRLSFFEKNLGKRLSVLPENKVSQEGYMKGFSENYIPVFIPYDSRLIQQLVSVCVSEIKDGRVFGVVLS